jgi:nitroreductase
MNTVDLTNLIKSRRSIRAWQDKPVPEKVLLEAIELATYAPNSGNQQNWRFYVILNRDTIKQIADAVQAKANLVGSWPEAAKHGEAADRMVKRSSYFRSAPAAIAIAASEYQSPLDMILEAREKIDPAAAEIRRGRIVANSKVQSAAAAITTLLLVLHQAGLGALWMTGPTLAKADIERILKVPAGMDIITFIPVGYPAENPPLKERKPVKEVTEIIR